MTAAVNTPAATSPRSAARTTTPPSLGRTGSCFDNAVSESFNATYKKELIHTRPWASLDQVIRESREWFTYYNTLRRHSFNNYLTPFEKEIGFTALEEIARMKIAA
ncbi:MAG: integrase core domain-containing protein [Actinomycetales bacterium]